METFIRWRGERSQTAWRREPETHFGRRIVRNRSALLVLLAFSLIPSAYSDPQQKPKLSQPRQLDQAISWQRDSATGEIHAIPRSGTETEKRPAAANTDSIRIVTQMVPLTCRVYATDGTAVPGLERANFHVYDNGVEQKISYFDASSSPASIALVIDASPSVLRDSDEMKKAAVALVDALAPLDQAAVVDFSAHTYVQLPFSDVRELLRRAVARIDVRQLLSDTGGSNIYEAIYLTAHELFAGRSGRKAIVLLTDGQDSGLDLKLDAASASPQPGKSAHRLTFDDVSRILTGEDIQLFVVSTENRPKTMTPEWVEAHRGATLISPDSRRLGIPPYTLYLAEMVRRTGGELDFLRESSTMADAFRSIARKIRVEYTLGYYPTSDSGADTPSRHELKVEVEGPANVSVIHRASYYVAAR
jgi:Ca-activated chloride channel family protein